MSWSPCHEGVWGLDPTAIAKETWRGRYAPLARDLISPLPAVGPASRTLCDLPAHAKLQTIGLDRMPTHPTNSPLGFFRILMQLTINR